MANSHHKCQFVALTPHHYNTVGVNYAENLCEVGEGCYGGCPFSFQATDVIPCPECNGRVDVDCKHCFDFGYVRRPKAEEAAKG